MYFRHKAGNLKSDSRWTYRTIVLKKESLAFAACRLNVIGLLA